ncbi:hypothetical protein J4476_04160 [Candidatus Woesearchaeota archaeon]|nr:MAG: hypothetical protein QT09_C0007G0072 [archaeon GW2011_AR18]MBS3161859.1 hypothetical protein [Candidatus Woesearchaeota archaeon]HIH25611.1 hypothetical protein [Nanoarchaeota archaeon]
MKIYFFEEFPNDSSLSKLSLVKFPTKLIIADYSIEGFNLYDKEIRSKYKNVKELIWWPLLNMDEGYWFSPFSRRRALLRTFHHLLNKNIPIMWDAEFPKKRFLMFSQLFKVMKNIQLIRSFFKKYKGKIYTAEYFIDVSVMKFLFKLFALQFNPKEFNNKIIKMMYTSTLDYPESLLRSELKTLKYHYKDNVMVGLGCLAVGINGNESLISSKQLERDLNLCKEIGIKEVVLFRLGGLNKDYIKVLNKFVK